VLYGVTMQERGVSKIVSVKFHSKQDEASATPDRNGPGDSLEGNPRPEEDEEVFLAK
jgi:hypothetical protein